MTLKSSLAALLTSAHFGLIGCAGVTARPQQITPAVTHETTQHPHDGRDQFFDYLDANDVQVLGIGEMHLLDLRLQDQAYRQGTPLTLEIFTNDYLEGLASRGYNVIISEHFFQESMDNLDMFYAGQPIREGTALDRNFNLIPAAEEARAFLHRSRELGIRIYPGGFDRQDIEKIQLLEEIEGFAHMDSGAQATVQRLSQEIFIAIAEHTYHHAHNILQVNPNTRIVTYGGMLHNNTTLRPEAMLISGNAEMVAMDLSFADEFQRDLRQSGAYREVDIVQRDLVDLIVQGGQGQRGPQGATAQLYFLEYIMLTRQARTPRPYFRENPAQDRLLIVYGPQGHE